MDDLSSDFDAEPLEEDRLDLAEIAAEELYLALDPYPRAPGARVSAGDNGGENGPARTGPFAALAALKGKK